MRNVRRDATSALVVSIVFVLGSVTLAAAQEPSLDKLKSFLPPEPGQKVCLIRSYDSQHMRTHPKQQVRNVTFLLRVVRFDKNGDLFLTPDASRGNRIAYQFAMQVERRGHRGSLRTGGDCSGAGSAQCVVDCDGGGLTIEQGSSAATWRLRLLENGIRMHGDCEGEQVVWIGPGSDDREFLVNKTAANNCRALEQEELGK